MNEATLNFAKARLEQYLQSGLSRKEAILKLWSDIREFSLHKPPIDDYGRIRERKHPLSISLDFVGIYKFEGYKKKSKMYYFKF
jgi:hypothetical protein